MSAVVREGTATYSLLSFKRSSLVSCYLDLVATEAPQKLDRANVRYPDTQSGPLPTEAV